MKQIVIFGGMFDPPHIGHALDTDNALQLFPRDEVWIVPSGARLDKTPQTSNEDRWQMSKIFCEDYFSDSKTPVIAKRDEMDMEPPTYTWAFYQHLLKTYPGYEFHFLIGSTNVPTMKKWQHGEELFNEVSFLVAPQGEDMSGYVLPPRSQVLEGGRITTNISSTFIRGRLKMGVPSLPYVLPRIAAYIKDKGLYA